MTKEDKINIILFSIIPIYSLIYLFFRNDYVIDFVFVGLLFGIGALGIFSTFHSRKNNMLDNKFEMSLYFSFIIVIIIYTTNYKYENKSLFYPFFLLPQLLLLLLFLVKLTFNNIKRTKLERILLITFIIFLIMSIVAYVFLTNLNSSNENEILFVGLFFLIPLFLVPIVYGLYQRHKAINNEFQIEELEDLYKNNPAFHIHKIKNKLLSLQFLIQDEEIKPDLRQDIDDYLKAIYDVIDEFYHFDELNRKKQFALKDFVNTFEYLHKTELKRKRIAFETYLDNINPEQIINIPFFIFNTLIEILFDNSVYALKETNKKKIKISFAIIKEKLIVKFCDTGTSIPDKIENKIFQPGFSTKKEGKGIGLNQVKSILNTLNGTIFYKGSNSEYNTIFEIQIPIN